MNKFAIGALALTSAGSLAYAGGEETKEWSSFDRDILSLTANQGATAGSFGINGFVRARGARSEDVDLSQPERIADPAGGTPAGSVGLPSDGQQDLSGFLLDNARIELSASQGDYGAFISLDAVGGTATLLDAFGTFKIAEGITGQVGRFKAPFLWSSFLLNDNNQILLDRTFNGQNWQERQDGVQLSGVFDKLGWWAALQNGTDGLADEYMWTGRVSFNFLGTGLGRQEGAFGSSGDTPNITVGASYSDDEGVDKVAGHVNSGAAWAVDAGLTQGGVSLHFELVDYEEDIQPDSDLNLSTGVINPIGPKGQSTASIAGQPFVFGTFGNSNTPWSATAGYMLQPDVVEVVVRYEDLDDDDKTTVWTVGLNYYISGHNAKWTLQGSRSNSDQDFKEADTAAVGLTVGV